MVNLKFALFSYFIHHFVKLKGSLERDLCFSYLRTSEGQTYFLKLERQNK